MLSKQVNLLYTIVLSSCIARLYSVHVPEEKNIQQIEVGDFALINYKPDLEDDEDTLEDNICMEVETVDIQTGATATSLMIEYVSGDEICWDKGEELKLKTVMIKSLAGAVNKTFDVKGTLHRNLVKDLESGVTTKQKKIYNLDHTNKIMLGDDTGRYILSFKVLEKSYNVVPEI